MLTDKFYNREEKCWNVKICGEIDIYNAAQLKEELTDAVSETMSNMVIDCYNLTYIDSTGLGVLISVLKKLKEQGYGIKIMNLKPHIYKIFELTDLQRLFEIEVSKS